MDRRSAPLDPACFKRAGGEALAFATRVPDAVAAAGVHGLHSLQRATTEQQPGTAMSEMSVSDQPEAATIRNPKPAARAQRPRPAPIPAISISGWRRSRRWASSSASPPRSIPISKPRPSPISSALEKSPVLLFENIKGHPGHKALYNMIGCNLSRFCLMIGEEPVDHPLKAVQALQKKLGRKMAPKEVAADKAISNQNVVDRRRHRHPQIPGAADVAARRRQISRHRRRGGDQVPGDRAHQCRHLPHDDQGSARDRRLHLARQGRDARPREVVEDGQADADRGLLRHRSAAVSGRGDEPAEDRMRVRLLFRHRRRADRGVHRRRHRAAAAGARRDHPRRLRLSRRDLRGRAVRRVHRLLRAPVAARRRTCGSRRCAIATTRRSPAR